MSESQTVIDIAKTIAWHHSDRKKFVDWCDGYCTKRQRNDYYAEREYKTFIPAAKGVLALIESWKEQGAA